MAVHSIANKYKLADIPVDCFGARSTQSTRGVFALFNDLNISNSENLQLVVGESQLLELSSNVSGGSFQLGFNGVEAIVTIPSNFSGSDTGKLRQLARNTEIALNNALGANSMSVSLELNAVTPRFVINFRGEYLGTNVPKLNADFANLTATNGQPSGSITDDFLAPEATNSLAFRYSAITFFPDGVLPKAVITSDQPSLISSAGATRGLGLHKIQPTTHLLWLSFASGQPRLVRYHSFTRTVTASR